jgi:hypothetical protein
MSSSDSHTEVLLVKVRMAESEMMLSIYSIRTLTVTISLLLKVPSTSIFGLKENRQWTNLYDFVTVLIVVSNGTLISTLNRVPLR